MLKKKDKSHALRVTITETSVESTDRQLESYKKIPQQLEREEVLLVTAHQTELVTLLRL